MNTLNPEILQMGERRFFSQPTYLFFQYNNDTLFKFFNPTSNESDTTQEKIIALYTNFHKLLAQAQCRSD